MRAGSFSLFSLLVLVACSRGLAQGEGLADFPVEAYSVAGETIQQPSPQNTDIYQEVFKFYRPAGDRMRLLDLTLLPATREESQGSQIEASIAESMLAGLGKSFCVDHGERVCNGKTTGGELRISPVYQQSDGRVRVVVRFTAIEPYGPAQSSRQVFLLEQADAHWVIRARR